MSGVEWLTLLATNLACAWLFLFLYVWLVTVVLDRAPVLRTGLTAFFWPVVLVWRIVKERQR